MSPRRKNQNQGCSRCRLNKLWCYCDDFTPIISKVKITVIAHFRERYLTSNTALLAKNSLSDFQIIYRGHKDTSIDNELSIDSNEFNLVLFPAPDSKPLSQLEFSGKKLHLIIPDGTWRQAKKIQRREPVLSDLPTYHLDNIPQSSYLLRKQVNESGLCTFEAISHALKTLDSYETYDKLMSNFNTFNERLHLSRNIELYHKLLKQKPIDDN